ncbi:MAG: hypothetical protein N2442_08430 [Spirochaetes bacterium]|nr:hypothetical protein [Spirochaetota bacterium]
METVTRQLNHRLALGKENPAFYLVDDIDQAEKILFETSISMILAGNRPEENLSFLNALKEDELFRHLPVVILTPPIEGSICRKDIPFADLLLDIETPLESIVDYLYPLLRAKVYTDDLVKKISTLQDELMNKYLLIDLIKRYIPKTVWERANTFAEEQTIFIPEYEEEVAILYGDIMGFTRLAEHRQPKEVIDLLNEAYSVVTQMVYSAGGDIDKFIGDAFLAVHSDPLAAIQLALQIQEQLQNKPVKFRLGVHYGPVIRGNVGSELRSDNTLIGDTVNTAARIQEVTTPGGVLASEAVVQKTGMILPLTYRREMQFKGKEEPLVVYDVYRFFKESGSFPGPLADLVVHVPSGSN